MDPVGYLQNEQSDESAELFKRVNGTPTTHMTKQWWKSKGIVQH